MKTFIAIILVTLITTAAHASSCFNSLPLGEFPLGEWSDANRTWVESDTVGSFSDTSESVSALRTQRDTLLKQCSEKAEALIDKVEKRLNDRKDNLGTEFDKTCTDPIICPMIRDTQILSQTQEIEREIGRMKSWFNSRINDCKDGVNYAFNILSPLMCSQ